MSVITTTACTSAPSGAVGLTVTIGTAPTWGPWLQFIAATTAPIAVAGVQLSGGTYGGVVYEIDLGTGAAGAEVSIGTFSLFCDFYSSTSSPTGILLPVPLGGVTSGQRVAVRVRSQTAGEGPVTCTLLYYKDFDSTQVTTLAQRLSSAPVGTTSLVLTTNPTPWGDSAWYEVIASTATPIGILGICNSTPVGVGVDGFEYDIGIGAAGAETVLTTLRDAAYGDQKTPHTLLPGIHPVPSGSRVALRLRKAGTYAGITYATLLYYTNVSADVTVPDVVGLTDTVADAALVAAGLVTGTVTTAASDTVAAGLVISQSPAAGASVSPGAAVDYVVSTGSWPPVYEIGIGETTVVPLLATFRIQETIDAPDTMIADVFSVATPPALPTYQARILADGASAYWPLDDPSGTTARDLVGADDPVPFVRFSLGQPVVVTENGVRIFGGVVTGTRERGLTGPSATDLVVEVQATSYELSAARRVITAAFSQGTPAETIGAVFATLVTDYYAEVDVTLHPSQVAGPDLPAATFTRVRGDAVNKHLASSVGYLQSIDFENRLRAWAPGDVLAPDNYDEAVNPELLTGDITVERQLQNGYANRVILVGDGIPVPDHMDSFTGDGVTDTWPITYQVEGPLPYVADGAVAFAVVEYPATSSTESIGGLETSPAIDWEYDPIALTIHRRAGPVAAAVAFNFRYHGLFIPAGMAEDAGEIAAYGLWEHVENVTAVTTTGSAQDYAEALLAAKLASKDEIVRLQTRALGFHPGQTMTIASFSRELSGDYLITQVDTGSESGGILLVRSITASKSQNNTHDWRRVYQQWAGASAAQNP